MRTLATIWTLLFLLALPRAAAAFCGFYVSGADASLVNRATHVVMMREGTRTVLSMQNAYEGPPSDFALVVPVPVVLQKEQVKTLPRDVLDRVDHLGAPRLVEYWEQDPCVVRPQSDSAAGIGFGSGHGRLGGSHRARAEVTIEAQFAVGEYQIVILSATDSTALDTWLRDNHYKIPAGAEPYLRPYVEAGSKFFVAKVDISKVTMKDGRAALSPLRFHYDSERFSLPIRLGLINAGDAQDLVVSVLAKGKRYEAANYPNVVVPTNLDVSEATRGSFGSFYAALLDETLKQRPGTVVTEYAWDAGTCDPCPGPTLSGQDLATLGADALPEGAATGPMRMQVETPEVQGTLPPVVVQRILRQNTGRFRLCHDDGRKRNPNLQGSLSIKLVIGTDGEVVSSADAGSTLNDPDAVKCAVNAMRGVSFPAPESGKVTVTQRISFVANSAGVRMTGMVLTRLHMRYSKEALGEDLVLREALPITGGREVRGVELRLEQGAARATVNNFQARYAIRHPWTGEVACPNPVRGVWGGPPTGVAPDPEAAHDLAFVPRGAGLGAFLLDKLPDVTGPGDSPPPAPSGTSSAAASASGTSSAAPAPSGAAEPPPGSAGGCGCTVPAGGADHRFAAGALLLGLLLLRRRGARCRSPGRPATTGDGGFTTEARRTRRSHGALNFFF